MSKTKSFMAIKDHPDVPPINPIGHSAEDSHSEHLETEKDPPSTIEGRLLPVDIPEMKNLTVKRSYKRKFKPNNKIHEIDSEQSDFDPDSDPSDNEIQIQTKFEDQDDKSIPPDPITLAQNLFMYWQQYLNFHEHIEETEPGTIAQATIDELSILVSENSPSTGVEEAMEENM